MWDSGHILLKYMEQSNNKIFQEIRAMDATVTPQSYFRHQTILERGAGVGHVGLAIVLGLTLKNTFLLITKLMKLEGMFNPYKMANKVWICEKAR